ncbi:Immunoglobulin-like domain,Immunoglobulin-like fold [Cinara cedri]|uniref:Immunoglobulin-like domain,Immunoglobulin-like fold n=1 Tax=Cinara cedri TaxID=506608 RepID=A0A5E4MEI0_9HEMI|nr:Immunoglobulin-like domain,Immunoglobulin-like fold [Cinara cedri]
MPGMLNLVDLRPGGGVPATNTIVSVVPPLYSVTRQIKCAPSITVPGPKVEQTLRQNKNLECHVDAFPTPGMVWFKNGKQLYNYNNHYSIFEHVIIMKLQKGYYPLPLLHTVIMETICKAINGLGTAEAVI